MSVPEGFKVIRDDRLSSLPVHYAITDRSAPEGLLVFMPSALSSKRPDRDRIIYTRSKWQSSWPQAQVISMPDPAIRVDNRLNGAWFINPEYDVIETIATIVKENADASGIPHSRIVFYGSSLGGFGAIAAAAHIPGSRAVSEVPQINFENWMSSSRQAVEKFITKMPLEEYRKVHPEQLNLPARLAHAKNVPSFRIITNPTETSLNDQLDFYGWSRVTPLPHSEGPIELFQTTTTSGHGILGRKELIPFVNP